MGNFKLVKHKLYFIDFGGSRRLPRGKTIRDYKSNGGAWTPPEGFDNVDPYIYDIFALGCTVIAITEVRDLLLLYGCS